ncbi:hypothetical protein F5148DRAFT_1289770 [Russula earlei]|uniref:Uncharacterized protein n=1 Tax=Russula earlei TaxID=71964 RepID=A0ACC0TWS0_9AGAM|nr:hypothetical protein F5148DRAFT_1289770 [Russula earlei]
MAMTTTATMEWHKHHESFSHVDQTIAVDITRLALAPATRIRTDADDARADVIATRSEGSLPIASRPFVIAAPPRALDLQSEE